ncbi:hypothetical protein HUJ04_001455 [Dendroctonus ponderosae]|nr:hypothetical protein HUJ04_001455 [Dendroctonus ponderosae]
MVYKVSRAIAKLCSTFIAMPTTKEEIKESSVSVMLISNSLISFIGGQDLLTTVQYFSILHYERDLKEMN